MVHKDLEKFERTKTAGTTMPAIFQLRSRYTIAASQAALGSFYRWACRAVLFSACAVTAASRLTGASSRVAAAEDPAESAALDDAAASRKTQQEVMVARGFVRSRGAWRTVQEIELIERAERANLAQKEWNLKLGRLRKQLEQPLQADRAAEEIREICRASLGHRSLSGAVVSCAKFVCRSTLSDSLVGCHNCFDCHGYRSFRSRNPHCCHRATDCDWAASGSARNPLGTCWIRQRANQSSRRGNWSARSAIGGQSVNQRVGNTAHNRGG